MTVWTTPLLITFPGPGVLALAWTFAFVFGDSHLSPLLRTGLVAAWLLGAGLIALSIRLILHWAAPRTLTGAYGTGGPGSTEVSGGQSTPDGD